MNTKLRNVPFSPPDMSEAEAKLASEAILSGWITTGPKTKEFEKKIAAYVGTNKAVCLNSATAAMEMALRLIGVGPEDEVIVPAYTYTATASVTQHVGCKVVMVDSQKDNVEMDYDKLAEAITEHTKVICPVDLGGVMCDFDKIFAVIESKKHLFSPGNEIQKKIGRIIVAADDAHAFGAQWHGKMAGSIADFSSFSFHAVKNLTTAEGGALVWHLPFGKENVDVNANDNYFPTVPRKEGETWDEMLYRISQLLSLHGQNKDALAKTQLGAWEYDVIGPWYKCNMTDIMAGIGLAQLERYQGMLERRRHIIGVYDNALKDLPVAVLNHYGEDFAGSGHLYITRLLGRTDQERRDVIVKMAERGIACNVHYKPLPMMTAYKALGFDIKDYPNAYNLFVNEVTLPLHTRLTDEDVEYVISNYVDIIKNL
ncbi:MAG: DegT/DnrJ/EryC1/StrS family aminotransferase [Bacteroidales bacterium]|jgi:dTDP-4-amino-4,6-dideoxygalactose transaminase|nr:DegT/DnrJ/EryC1/StrS family aminotransferase [Bacteroidales bacterium]